ncbi:ABC transporter permease subunit [Bartonella sp. W8097]|uniref:ABC transporter permease subunit n=1 Tax=Bartonella apihabitans TaxID=2750929 RepID=UPI0018DD7D93|nr:ABC transporter permease subunit [Bartonella apihabitans]MBI0019809.1 ABC transporter permease subunit [Bartonella apihabitans]
MNSKADRNISADIRRQAWREFWFSFSMNRGAVIGLVVFCAIVLLAVLAPLIAPYGYDEQFRDAMQRPPVWQTGGTWNFVLGTDAVGRDILSRLLHGARYSLLVGVVVSLAAMIVGIVVGVIAGYIGGMIEVIIMRIMDIILAFPSLLLALVLVSIVGYGLQGAIIATAVALQPHFVRLARAAVLSEKNREYVIAAKLAGAGRGRLMFKTILPNCMAPIIVQGTFSFSNAILDVAALGFLGMGAQAPTPEWGTMLADAREFISSAWWIVTFPGLAILVLVLAINLMGDGLRDALDPKLKRS